MTTSEIKSLVRSRMKGKVLNLATVTVLPIFLLSFISSSTYLKFYLSINSNIDLFSGITYLFSSIVTSYFSIAILTNLIDWLRSGNDQHLDLSNFLSNYVGNFNRNLSILGSNLWASLIICLFCIIPVIGVFIGIVKAYEYYFVTLHKYDQPHLDFQEVARKSKSQMNGYKLDLFLQHLSFIGWLLLIPLTFGLAGIYVIPYITLSDLVFYEEYLK